jgi:hypothetical protein
MIEFLCIVYRGISVIKQHNVSLFVKKSNKNTLCYVLYLFKIANRMSAKVYK